MGGGGGGYGAAPPPRPRPPLNASAVGLLLVGFYAVCAFLGLRPAANGTAPGSTKLARPLAPGVCSPEALSAVIEAHGECHGPISRHLESAFDVFTYGEHVQTEQQKKACADAFRDPGNKSVDNDGIAESITILQRLKARNISTDVFDVTAYLKKSNPKERQHRLLCKLEDAQQKIEAAVLLAESHKAVQTVANNEHRMQTWTTVLSQQQAKCDVFSNTDWLATFSSDGKMPTQLSRWRRCLRSISDAESTAHLQCRAKEADSRTLFEVRDFMCLHLDKISRDVFYAKLGASRGVTEQVTMLAETQKYAEYRAQNAADPTKLKTASAMYQLSKKLAGVKRLDREARELDEKYHVVLAKEMRQAKETGHRPKHHVSKSLKDRSFKQKVSSHSCADPSGSPTLDPWNEDCAPPPGSLACCSRNDLQEWC